MKYIIIFVLAFILFLGGFLWISGNDFSFLNFNQAPKFNWGVGINPTATGNKSKESVEEIVKKAKNLGVNTARINYPINNPENINTVDWAIDKLVSKPKRVLVALILEHNDNILESSDPYSQGYKFSNEIAKKYQGKVSYYQMGNEVGAYALKPTWGGDTRDAYDKIKYQKALTWLKGVSNGIKAADPKAKRIVTGHHVQYAFWQMAKEDGLEFEIVGWDWFHQDFPVPSLKSFKKDDKPFDLLSKLNDIGDVWITEAGVNGAVVGYDKASDYLSSFAKEVYSLQQMKGFFAFSLTDEVHQNTEKNWQKGLIALQKNGKKWVLGEERQTFSSYSDIIKLAKSKKLERDRDTD